MKKIIYSPLTKALAVLIYAALSAFAAGNMAKLAADIDYYQLFTPTAGGDYRLISDLRSVSYQIVNAIENEYVQDINIDSEKYSYRIIVPSQGIDTGNRDSLRIYDNEFGLTLCSSGNPDETEYMSTLSGFWFDVDDIIIPECSFTICYTDEYFAVYESERTDARIRFYSTVRVFAGAVILLLLAAVYLCFICGRRAEDDKVHLLLLDRVFPEIQLFLGGAAGFAAAAVTLILLDELYTSSIDVFNTVRELFCIIAAAGAAVVMLIVLTVLLSIVRIAKNRTLIKSSLIALVLKTVWKWAGKVFRFIFRILRRIRNGIITLRNSIITYKTVRFAALYASLLTAIAFMFGFFRSGNALVLIIILWGVALLQLTRAARDIEKVSAAVRAIQSGDTEYKIEISERDYFRELEENVNSIGDGISAAVQKNISAERMKTELITNVSHDLKTPLTSIISYADLLCDTELSPPEANDYAEIIRKKSERLKNLTSDLFDISKAQSGNENIVRERIDLSLLVSQSLGESDSVIENAGLIPVVSIEKEQFIIADGNKLSRVFENLTVNIAKYAQKGTRVFITVTDIGGRVKAEFKNTSAEPLNFDTSEITERFVRGDSSRSTEGSGLGLAIAKSYTELCGGTFTIETDGDLFKAIVCFDKSV